MGNPRVAEVSRTRFVRGENPTTVADMVAIEEPLEIQLGIWNHGRFSHRTISITMRTPGDDFELAAGFLFTEGIIRARSDVREIRHCGPAAGANETRNVVRVDLEEGVEVDFKRLERHIYTASSCGVCGKTSIEAVNLAVKPSLEAGPHVAADVIRSLPASLDGEQEAFASTGGIHAAALFDTDGKLLGSREDVGRHNALDKIIGAQFLAEAIPLGDRVMLVSGRAGFELVQKCLAAGCPILAAIGAPSSLAIDLAREFGMTLVGFLRAGQMNVYSGAERIG
ncbi:MAG: formate dehydrogenase accessory sulfurtransferase FdhD [Thermoanaerobaculia bacterium]